jgi:DNA anti-recombination protein RmuC
MELFFAILLALLAVILWLVWHLYKNQSTPQNLNSQEISKSLAFDINHNLAPVFDRMDEKQNQQNQTIDQKITQLEVRFGDIKTNLAEELGKINLSLQTQLREAITAINDSNTKNFDLLAKTNHEKLTQIQGEVDKRLTQSFEQHLKSFETVNKNIGEMQSTAQKMMDSTKSVDKLNTIFERTNSKAFGQFSETYLETILKEHLNIRDWAKQVTAPNSNDKIDFVIYVGDKKIGIDSKFPVTRYQDYIDAPSETKTSALKDYLKSVILMANEISKKYLKPGFIDTLLLFLPSDSMYNEVVNNPDTMEHLRKVQVTPISPTTIFPIIVIINNYEFRLKVNENAEMIMKGLQGVSKNVDSFRDEFRKLGDKIRQAQDNFDKADKNLIGLQSTIRSLKHEEEVEVQDTLELENAPV